MAMDPAKMLRVVRPVRTGARLALLGVAFGLPAAGFAQMGDGSQPTVALGNARMVRGTVTATAPDHLTVKTEAGDVYDVVTTPNTRVTKGREPMKLADIHAGDGVGAMGEIDPAKKTVHALMVQVVDAEAVKKAREALGKTMIAGTVTAIDELKLTIKRTDDVVQVIQVDEDTSFKKGRPGMAMALSADGTGGGMGGGGMGGGRGQRGGGAGAAAAAPAADSAESLTLAAVKVGNVVRGPGTSRKGSVVPTTLAIGVAAAPRQRRRPDGAAGPGAGPAGAASTDSPSTAPPSTTTPASPASGTSGTEPK